MLRKQVECAVFEVGKVQDVASFFRRSIMRVEPLHQRQQHPCLCRRLRSQPLLIIGAQQGEIRQLFHLILDRIDRVFNQVLAVFGPFCFFERRHPPKFQRSDMVGTQVKTVIVQQHLALFDCGHQDFLNIVCCIFATAPVGIQIKGVC